MHDHSFGNARTACDLQLGHFLDLDQTDPAQAHRVHLRMIAIHRNRGPQLFGGFDHKRPLGNRYRAAVDDDVDHPPAHVGFAGAHATLNSRARSGHPACVTCAANSSGKRFKTEAKNGMMESPSGHKFVPVIVLLMTLSTRKSCSLPSPASKRDTMRATHWPPSRQGVH